MRRLIDLTIVTIWLCSIAGLVWYDIKPTWKVGTPPIQVPAGTPDKPVQMQFVIQTPQWGQIGQSWVEFWRMNVGAVARSTTILETGPLGRAIHVDSHISFDEKDQLDDLKVWVTGLPAKVEVEAANYGEDFPCVVTVGDQRHEFSLHQEMAAAMAEVFRPFVYLKGLHVGQTWRIANIDLLGSLWGQEPTPEPVVAKVVGREPIVHEGRRTECFRVETKGATAWVDDDGRVLLQEVDLPILGKVSIRLVEGFDWEELKRAREDDKVTR